MTKTSKKPDSLSDKVSVSTSRNSEVKTEKLTPRKIGIIAPCGYPDFPEHWSIELTKERSSDQKSELAGYKLRNGKKEGAPALIVFHGFGEYTGRYMHWANHLDGFLGEIWAIDHLGHGRSQGKRGHTEDLKLFTEDMDQFLRKVLSETKSKKVFAIGHSFGGLLIRRALMEKKSAFERLSGVLVSAPYLGLRIKVPAVKEFAAKILSKAWSGLSLRTEFDPSVLTQDPRVQEAYHEDRLNHSRMTPGMYREIVKSQNELLRTDVEVKVPVGMWISVDDPLVDGEKAVKFYENHLKGEKREIFPWHGFRHEMMNDLNKGAFFESIQKWMEKN